MNRLRGHLRVGDRFANQILASRRARTMLLTTFVSIGLGLVGVAARTSWLAAAATTWMALAIVVVTKSMMEAHLLAMSDFLVHGNNNVVNSVLCANPALAHEYVYA